MRGATGEIDRWMAAWWVQVIQADDRGDGELLTINIIMGTTITIMMGNYKL